ncbi:MAG: acetylornithine deacetylase, partial [Pseudomonadales bacterium]|nr:acetylornithine deacetylase [Pseudomonadales bacterium]
TRGKGSGGLVLAGHTDTVPLDEALWHSDPFRLTEADGRWWGLGSCDMKGFFALALEAIALEGDVDYLRPLTIVATADEESSMSGARALQAAELCGARFAVIGEPTELRPVTRHKGIMMANMNIQGKAGHSSNPALGNNAIDASAIALQELMSFRTELARRYHDPGFEVAVPTLNLGCIHGGDNPNRICDHVDISFDIRVLPGMDNTNMLEEIRARVEPKLTDLGLTLSLDLCHEAIPPFESTGNELATTLANLTGYEPRSVAFGTEAPFLSALGMETVVMGPGSIDQAHQPDEFLEIAQVDPTIAIIRRLIRIHCLAE